jgi:uncharacterized membrane protein
VDVFQKGLITILGCEAVFAAISIPLVLRKIPRNIVYGFRTRTTLSDDFIWYEANAYFGRALLIASGVSAAAILLVWASARFSPDHFLLISIVILVGPSLAATIATFRFVRSLRQRGANRADAK